MFSGLIHGSEASIPPEEARGPSLVLTADPKPRLRWTADLHDRFVDAVAQLGGPESSYLLLLVSSIEAIPASLAIKYRLGKQSGKELTEQSKDGQFIDSTSFFYYPEGNREGIGREEEKRKEREGRRRERKEKRREKGEKEEIGLSCEKKQKEKRRGKKKKNEEGNEKK
ncbi:hypothetical protein GW17_00040111 [Ensete ventricosum]|nr:hypothetical protein GW17_00040111 [Ensete ventricosum]